MKNKKINKPIVSIGFETKGKNSGKIVANIDRNKFNSLNKENLKELKEQLEHALSQVRWSKFETVKKLTERQKEEIDTLLDEQKTLGAIKAYKEFVGAGLKDAKDFMDGYIKFRSINKNIK